MFIITGLIFNVINLEFLTFLPTFPDSLLLLAQYVVAKMSSSLNFHTVKINTLLQINYGCLDYLLVLGSIVYD